MTALERIAGMQGSTVISGTGAQTSLNYRAVVVNSDAVFTAFKITITGGTETDYMTIMNLTGNTIKAGGILTAPEGSRITSITMSSGVLIGY